MRYDEAPINTKLYAVKDVGYYDFLTAIEPVIHIGELHISRSFWSGKALSPYRENGTLSKTEWNASKYHFFESEAEARAYAYHERLGYVERTEKEIRNTFPEINE